MSSRRHLHCFLTLAVVANQVAGSASSSEVASLADLQARIKTAVPGDVIVVKDGVYTTSASPSRGCMGST
jgi:hypothetical protein